MLGIRAAPLHHRCAGWLNFVQIRVNSYKFRMLAHSQLYFVVQLLQISHEFTRISYKFTGTSRFVAR